MKQKILALLATVLIALPIIAEDQASINLVDNHKAVWGSFLASSFESRDNEKKVDALLKKLSIEQHTVFSGASGGFEKYYLIDDFIQIRANFDRNHQLIETPVIMPRGKWLKYPSGIAIDVTVEGENVKPEEFLKYFENALNNSFE